MTSQLKDDRAAALRRAIQLKRAAARAPSTQLAARPGDQKARLGELQRSLWLLHQLEPDSAAYNLTSAFRVAGELDASELQRSLSGVIARHRLLRSTFCNHHDEILQVIAPQVELHVERFEVDGGAAETTAVSECRKPFDLQTGPLIRLLLIEEQTLPTGGATPERLLVLVLHHILADERSLGFLWKDLAAGYGGSLATAAPPQYDDYVYGVEGRDDPKRADEVNYWRDQLEPLPEDLMLPFERPPGHPVGGRLLRQNLSPDLGRRIREFASTHGTTPFVVFAFVFRLLLHRYTEGRNIAFATPVSQRSHSAMAEMLGYFLNPVVIHANIDEERTVERGLAEFGQRLRDAMAHSSVPFDLLVEELSPPRSADRHPLFQSMFVYQETPPSLRLGNVSLQPIHLDLEQSKFDLTFFASDADRSTDIAVEYRTDRFEDVWMQRLLTHYATLLGHLVEDPQRPIRKLTMLSAEEQATLDAFSRGVRTAGHNEPNLVPLPLLPQQIFDQVQRSPQVRALINGGQEWSYGQLGQVARQIAAQLLEDGVAPGDRVGLFVDRSPWMIAGILGCHWAGTAYVPLDPAYPPARNQAVLEDAEVAAVLTRSTLRPRLSEGTAPCLEIDPISEATAPESQTERPPVTLRGDLPAYILYTSGSTGRPKGVVISHDNLRASNGARSPVYGTPPKRYLLLSSVAFDSSVVGIFWTLAEGGTLVIPTDDEARDPQRLAQLITTESVTHLLCVPSLYSHLLSAGASAGETTLGSLETVIVAGESCPQQLVEEHFRRLPQTRLFNEYGPTEATVWASVEELGPQDGERPVAIGRPIPGVRIDLLDRLGHAMPVGIPAQGWISGPTLAQGYWRQQALTDECFVKHIGGSMPESQTGSQPRSQPRSQPAERMYRTGDRMQWTDDGRLLFLGRVDEQVKLRGFRIEPGEIETLLLEYAAIEAAAVVVRDAAQLVAFIVSGSKDGASADGSNSDRRRDLAQRLPEHMVPSRIVTLPRLPQLPNGKVDRRQLRDMPLHDTPLDAEAPTTTPTLKVLDDRQQALVALWQGLLGHEGITPSDNFFQLGGHSLLAVELTSAIQRDFGVALRPADVFQHPTIEGLAQRMEQQGRANAFDYAHLFPLQPGGRQSPIVFSVPHFFSQMFASRFRGERPVYGLRGVSLREDGNRGRWRTLEDLGDELVREIEHRFPDRSFHMVGYSFGASMAVEAVRLMEARGIAVHQLILIAPMPVDVYRFGPLRLPIDNLRQPVEELSFGQALGRFVRRNHPLTRGFYQRLRRRLVVQPWRRLLCWIGALRARAGLPLTSKILHADVRLERFRLHGGYRPGIVQTPTVIFNAREPETDAAATWRPYFEGPFTVHPIPDPHLDDDSIRAAKEQILHHLRDLGDA